MRRRFNATKPVAWVALAAMVALVFILGPVTIAQFLGGGLRALLIREFGLTTPAADLLQALAHLSGSLIGEGHCQNPPGGNLDISHQGSDSARDDSRLSRARSGQHQERPALVQDRLALWRVQVVQEVVHESLRSTPGARKQRLRAPLYASGPPGHLRRHGTNHQRLPRTVATRVLARCQLGSSHGGNSGLKEGSITYNAMSSVSLPVEGVSIGRK